MKLFFISDIHGSFYFLEKAMEQYKKENGDYIVILGDELYHGARNPLPEGYDPKEVAKLLNSYGDKIIAVRGNCDSEVDEMVLEFPMMATYSVIFHGGKRLFLTHGHLYDGGNSLKLNKGDVLIYGHTHIPVAEVRDGIGYINPGSISMPKENNPNSYGVLEGDIFRIKDLDGKVFKEINLSSF